MASNATTSLKRRKAFEGNSAYVYFTPGDTTLVAYVWDFGDGNSSRFAKDRNLYDENGTYIVSLYGGTDKGSELEILEPISLTKISVPKIDGTQFFSISKSI